jgi:TonB-dependent SusC/RagA subfamily outer membrane receptor
MKVNAQDKIVQGLVTTFDSICVIGAEVQVKSSKEIVKTDTLGCFSVSVQKNDQLKVRARGFYLQKVKLGEKTKLVAVNLKLKTGEKARSYAIGYGYVKDAQRLSAISQINSDDMNFSQYTDMYEVIRGRFSGVQIQSNGDIIVRGINSFTLSNAALLVVDGVVVDGSVFGSIPPAQVKSVDVLKDGGAAIYGSRGANGVVLVETKKGGDD